MITTYNAQNAQMLYADVVNDAFALDLALLNRGLTSISNDSVDVERNINTITLFPIKGNKEEYIKIDFGKHHNVSDATLEMTDKIRHGIPALRINILLNSLAISLR